MSGYGSSYHSSGSGTSWGQLIVGVILVIFLTAAFKSCSRSKAHMVYIEDCYVYNEDSYIIYIESESGRYGTHTTYTVFYDENGKKNKYNPETEEWIPLD